MPDKTPEPTEGYCCKCRQIRTLRHSPDGEWALCSTCGSPRTEPELTEIQLVMLQRLQNLENVVFSRM